MWVGESGDQRCLDTADCVVTIGDQVHLSCRNHAVAEGSDPAVGTLPLLESPVPLPVDTYLVVDPNLEGPFRGAAVVAWHQVEPGPPDEVDTVCVWFDPEHPETAPQQWPTFDAYYEVLCDPAELETDDEAGAQAAAAQVRGYLRTLNPDPADTKVFRCRWLAEYDGVNDETPNHGWALVVPVQVRAALSHPGLTGSDPLWPVSAEGVAEANSWTGAEHGWEVGCAHLLNILPPGTAPTLHLVPQPST